jgi:hypothetical protein
MNEHCYGEEKYLWTEDVTTSFLELVSDNFLGDFNSNQQ